MATKELPVSPMLRPISDLAVLVGISPAALYQAGCRGELSLRRIRGGWCSTKEEVESFAERRAASAQVT